MVNKFPAKFMSFRPKGEITLVIRQRLATFYAEFRV